VVPAVAVEGEVKRLKEYLEASQAALEATKQEVQSIRDQLVTAESWVASKFSLAILVHPFLLVLLLILFHMGQS
jgi:DnaJ-domain-containing protein 1